MDVASAQYIIYIIYIIVARKCLRRSFDKENGGDRNDILSVHGDPVKGWCLPYIFNLRVTSRVKTQLEVMFFSNLKPT